MNLRVVLQIVILVLLFAFLGFTAMTGTGAVTADVHRADWVSLQSYVLYGLGILIFGLLIVYVILFKHVFRE